jgi:hypothetical protein
MDLPASTSDRQAKLGLMARVPPKVREIAWKAQSRLTARFRAFRRAARG